MDSLNITALQVATKIGIYNWEQRIDQQLLIGISIPCDFRTCQDTIESTIDYDALCQKVTEYVASKSFQIIETVANEVAQLIQKEFNVSKVTVSVTKPHAVKNAGGIQVVVTRGSA